MSTEQMDWLDAWTREQAEKRHARIEDRLGALIQPKPKWLPQSAWERVLKRVLVLVEFRR